MSEAISERDAVVAWLDDRMLDDAPRALVSKATWRAVLWAVTHPFQFAEERGRFYALRDMQDAIERGEHLNGEIA